MPNKASSGHGEGSFKKNDDLSSWCGALDAGDCCTSLSVFLTSSFPLS